MLNDIKIHGYLGRDPELKEYKNAKGETGRLVNFPVGVSRDMTDETDWFDVTMFGKRAEVIEKFFQKGSQIVVSGRMQCDNYEKDGQKRKAWKLIASSFDFCDSKGSKSDKSDSWEKQEEDIPF